ncbi:hypothetical protein PAMC26510_26330 [Caballeronia sordidicola]|uniref:Uncharacterized protein n=1 Tax=Caballeronia sordidicola TaxID=196367 RepID=A0A242MF34_CABSO|nr:hypothetical protein PAMC26510_26330 [Caballeronia sordidicola]
MSWEKRHKPEKRKVHCEILYSLVFFLAAYNAQLLDESVHAPPC